MKMTIIPLEEKVLLTAAPTLYLDAMDAGAYISGNLGTQAHVTYSQISVDGTNFYSSGTFTTNPGFSAEVRGSITIDSYGNYTYTPPQDSSNISYKDAFAYKDGSGNEGYVYIDLQDANGSNYGNIDGTVDFYSAGNNSGYATSLTVNAYGSNSLMANDGAAGQYNNLYVTGTAANFEAAEDLYIFSSGIDSSGFNHTVLGGTITWDSNGGFTVTYASNTVLAGQMDHFQYLMEVTNSPGSNSRLDYEGISGNAAVVNVNIWT